MGLTAVPFTCKANEDKEFKFKWTRSTFGQWPENPAYGMSLSLNAWGE